MLRLRALPLAPRLLLQAALPVAGQALQRVLAPEAQPLL